ncbi:DnaJ domain-containing protein [Mariannaea sp. PMI_226]|nr:DnaJ domain-containing protein [Mariannaea sp. PMI_226]
MAHHMSPDCYAILEILPDADDAVIRASYRRLAKLRHPDRNPDNPEATTQFQILQQAYSTLADPRKRRRFDRQWQKLNNPPVDIPDVTFKPEPAPQQEMSEPHVNPSLRVREGRPRREKGEAYRRSAEEQSRLAQAEAARLQREMAAQQLRESGQRVREAATRIREAAFRYKEERDRRVREEAAKQNQHDARNMV